MATITPRTNKQGEVISYRLRACVGRDETTYKQVWRTTTIKRPEGLTPAREKKEVARLADAWELEQKEQYRKDHAKTDRSKAKQNITLRDFIEKKWIPNHVLNGEHTPSTANFYKHMASDIIDYFGDRIKLSEIDGEIVEQYQIHLRTKAVTKAGKPYSQTSVKRHIETLRNVLRFALAHKYIKQDPFTELYSKSKADSEVTEVDFLHPEEAAEFLRCLEGEPLFWKCFMRLLLSCGLRRGECCGLQWGDWDETNMKLLIRRNVTVAPGEKDGRHVGATKSKRQRAVPMTPTLNRLLEEFRQEQIQKYGQLPPDSFIFCTIKNQMEPLYPTTPTTWLSRFEKRNGLREISPHDLRHSAGSLAKLAGADLKDIQALLGHSDLKTTARFYIGVTEESTRSVVVAAENLIEDQ